MLGTRANVGWAGVAGAGLLAGATAAAAAAWTWGGEGRTAAKVDWSCRRRLACAYGDDGLEMAASR